MKQAELQHYRAMLQAQAVEPAPRRALFGGAARPAIVSAAAQADAPPPSSWAAPRTTGLFGRRRADPAPAPAPAAEPLLLETPAAPQGAAPARLRLRVPAAAAHFSETPFHAEDLADPAGGSSLTAAIAGWSPVKPPSAELRLLRRLAAVIDAESGGLRARLAAAGVEAA